MAATHWHRQTPAEPLYPDLLWSRPETKALAGKLLIAGGNAQGFAAAAEAFAEAARAGIGSVRVLLPDSLQKTVGRTFQAGEYAPSTPSGSFSRRALAELLAMSQWSDAVLLAGDLGRNSETAVLIEQFTEKYAGRLTLTKDAADYVTGAPGALLVRPDTLLVISFAQLRRLAMSARFTYAFTTDMGLVRVADNLHEFTAHYPINIVVRYLDTLVVASGGQVSSTSVPPEPKIWRVAVAAHASVWWLQNPGKTFEALTTATLEKADNP